ncbi:M48 family metallopeptidase [Paraferrimonas sp. SM1919]|uniref:M48 metallopeptidase family protein n=1 Tax=Paraferrimonas sp. SM1919 TaxID=2662263 RepID=UPI0013D1985F|nr:YgjP-like metallopeptidase domain-containing protein [Paraferrimonas sp. SM1919]
MDIREFLQGYPADVVDKVVSLHKLGKLKQAVLARYQEPALTTNNELYQQAMDYKNRYLKKSGAIAKVLFDDKISLQHQALGLHTYASRNHGGKLKAKNEIRISSSLKQVPRSLLMAVLVHELAHLKEKQHDKAFYRLCQHMMPDYLQREFDLRLLLIAMQSS